MEIRESDFAEMVLNADRPVLVDFWASWCPPCKMMQPVVDKLSIKVADWADVYSVNIDRCPALAGLYQVSGVPTFISFADGSTVDRRTGALTEGQLLSLLQKAETAMPRDDDPATGDDLLNSVGPMALDSQPLSIQRREKAGETPALPGARTSRPLLESTNRLPLGASRPYLTVVSGLPRSGTSLMMRMLEAGGVPALCDERRTADEDNPHGYYEFENVKDIKDYGGWIDRSPGHSVKMVYSLLEHLPADRVYRVVFMRRNVDEILRSQKSMLERHGIATDIPDSTMKQLFERELRQFYTWLPAQTHLQLINVSYNDMLSRPAATLAQVNHHFDDTLDVEAMLTMIDPQLYRHRAA